MKVLSSVCDHGSALGPGFSLRLWLLLGCIEPTSAPPIGLPATINRAGSTAMPSPNGHAHASIVSVTVDRDCIIEFSKDQD